MIHYLTSSRSGSQEQYDLLFGLPTDPSSDMRLRRSKGFGEMGSQRSVPIQFSLDLFYMLLGLMGDTNHWALPLLP